MLKKLNKAEVDNIMEFWKNEDIKNDSSYKNKDITSEYTKMRDDITSKDINTTIYTEDDEMYGYISISNKNEIYRNTC